MLLDARGQRTSISWPPATGLDLTTVFGTHSIFPGPPNPAVGSLLVTNTSGGDSAYTYVTALSSAIRDSSINARSASMAAQAPRVQGLWCRGVLNASPTILDSGWRSDLLTGALRLVRFNPGSNSLADSVNLSALSPTYDHYLTSFVSDVTFNMLANGPTVESWLTCPGQPDTPHVKTTSASTTEVGRIGFFSFFNFGGAGGSNYWATFSATWGT